MLSCRIKEALSMMPYTFAKYKYGGRRFFADFFGVRVDTAHMTWEEAGDVGTAGHIIDSRQTLHLIKL